MARCVQMVAHAQPARSLEAAHPALMARRALDTPGRPLDAASRRGFEPRFAFDFSRVRVHSDTAAAQGAHAIDAAAYTMGSHIVFGEGRFSPGSIDGARLLAHELTHVVQQSGSESASSARGMSEPTDASEIEADRTAADVVAGRDVDVRAHSPRRIQRARICARKLEASAIAGLFANHAWIDDTGRDDCRGAGMPGNYAVMELVSGSGERGCALKTDRSPDPSVSEPQGKPCRPRAGVSDVSACLRAAFDGYASPGTYSTTKGVLPWTFGAAATGLAVGATAGALGAGYGAGGGGGEYDTGWGVAGGIAGGLLGLAGGALVGMRIGGGGVGPNSNTFAGTLARACCADASDSELGWVPGWDKPAAVPCSAEELRLPREGPG